MNLDQQLDNERKRIEETSDFYDLERHILHWAVQRNLVFPENAKNQLLKSFAEMGELADALLKDDKIKIIDGIGDVLVTLIILANSKGLDITECLSHAYNEIKHRNGKTVNGTFIKE